MGRVKVDMLSRMVLFWRCKLQVVFRYAIYVYTPYDRYVNTSCGGFFQRKTELYPAGEFLYPANGRYPHGAQMVSLFDGEGGGNNPPTE